MSTPLTFAMPTYKHHFLAKTTSYVALSLGLNMLEIRRSSIVHYMAAKLPALTSVTIFVSAWRTWVLNRVLLIPTYGCAQQRRPVAMPTMNMCFSTLMIVISHKGESEIGRYFELKEESIGVPDIYLGGKLRAFVW
jgi:hypothetical protein